MVIEGFERPNIVIAVERFVDGADKDRALVERAVALAQPGATGIVYVGTRRRCEELAEQITAAGASAAAYHAGLPRSQRDAVHDAFHDGSVRVVVATTAFGMGIDKPDVRFVLHGDVPESVDAYYQQIGRAGRDGSDAEAVLFYRPEDLARNRFRTPNGAATDRAVAVLATLTAAGTPLERAAIVDRTDLSARAVTQAVHLLEDAGLAVTTADGPVATGARGHLGRHRTGRAGARRGRGRPGRAGCDAGRDGAGAGRGAGLPLAVRADLSRAARRRRLRAVRPLRGPARR